MKSDNIPSCETSSADEREDRFRRVSSTITRQRRILDDQAPSAGGPAPEQTDDSSSDRLDKELASQMISEGCPNY